MKLKYFLNICLLLFLPLMCVSSAEFYSVNTEKTKGTKRIETFKSKIKQINWLLQILISIIFLIEGMISLKKQDYEQAMQSKLVNKVKLQVENLESKNAHKRRTFTLKLKNHNNRQVRFIPFPCSETF